MTTNNEIIFLSLTVAVLAVAVCIMLLRRSKSTPTGIFYFGALHDGSQFYLSQEQMNDHVNQFGRSDGKTEFTFDHKERTHYSLLGSTQDALSSKPSPSNL